MRLWLRLALLLVVLSVPPLLFTGFEAVRIATRSAIEQGEAQLERDAANTAEQIGRWVRDQAGFLVGWTQLHPHRLGTAGPALQDGLVRAVWLAMPSAAVVALVDADGVPVVPPRFASAGEDRPPADPERAEQLVGRLPLSEALTHGVHIGSPYLAGPGDVPSVPIAVRATVPAADEADHPDQTLVLGAEIRLRVVHEILARATEDVGFALLDGDGVVLAGSEHPLIRPRLVRPLAGTTARFSYALESQEGVMGAVAPVPGTDWSLIVVQPRSQVAQAALQIRARGLAVLQLSVAAALFFSWMLAQSLGQLVERLRDAALAVAEGDYGRRVEIARRDELGELASAFNHMSERLLTSQREILAQQEEIEAFNRELQDRVEQRTRELQEAQDQLVRSGQLAAVAEIGAGMAHELNNPLAAILGLTQLLRARRTEGPDVALLHDIEEQAERCREVVATLVRFSEGEVDPDTAPVVDLRVLLREVATLVRGPFRQRGVALELVEPASAQPGPAGGALPVRIDPVHGTRILAQVLNALRAGLGEGATLRMSAASAPSGEVQVRLEPNTPVAMDESRRDDWRASGMGLWVARRLLHELGGRLEEPGPEDPSWRVVLPGA